MLCTIASVLLALLGGYLVGRTVYKMGYHDGFNRALDECDYE